MSWQHVAMCTGDLMSRKGLSDQTPGVCHLQPHAFFFIFGLSVSALWFGCFPFPVTPGKAVEGEKKTLPASQHIPAPNAWAQPHIVGILSFKGAAVLCLPTQHHSFICRHVWRYLGIMFSQTVGELYGWNITWEWGYRAQKYFLFQTCFKIMAMKNESAWYNNLSQIWFFHNWKIAQVLETYFPHLDVTISDGIWHERTTFCQHQNSFSSFTRENVCFFFFSVLSSLLEKGHRVLCSNQDFNETFELVSRIISDQTTPIFTFVLF